MTINWDILNFYGIVSCSVYCSRVFLSFYCIYFALLVILTLLFLLIGSFWFEFLLLSVNSSFLIFCVNEMRLCYFFLSPIFKNFTMDAIFFIFKVEANSQHRMLLKIHTETIDARTYPSHFWSTLFFLTYKLHSSVWEADQLLILSCCRSVW